MVEEAGEDVEGMAESTSTLQAKLKALTHGKVDIMIDEDTFKNTTQILREMSGAWEDMTDIERASALELMGGKRQANILSSVIKNFDTVEDVIKTSMDSSGSALLENEKYLTSIQGRIDLFTNSLQTMWMNFINSDVIKWVVDLGTKLMKLIDTIGVIPSALAGVAFYLTAIKKNNPLTWIKDFSVGMHNYGSAINQIKSIQSLNVGGQMSTEAFNAQHINAYSLAVQGLTQKQQVAALATAGLTKEQIAQAIGVKDLTDKNFQAALSEAQVTNAKQKSIAVSGALILSNKKNLNVSLSTTAQNWLEAHSEEEITRELLEQQGVKAGLSIEDRNAILLAQQQTQANMQQAASWKALTTSIGKMILQNPVMFFTMIATALSSLINKIETAADRTEKLTEAYNNLKSNISELEGDISSLESELNTIQEKIDEINNKDSLSVADAEQLKLLQQQSSELQHQKELKESLLDAREAQNQKQSLSMIDNMLKTTAANQQKAAESGKEWGKWIGGAALAIAAVAGVLLAVPTGGLSLGATTISAGTIATGAGIAGATLGSAAGSKIGESIGMSNKEAGGSLIEWYESYEKAIADAEAKASEAEAEYFNDMTEDNRDKWKKKVEEVTTLQTEMYDGLTDLQEYISNLEYSADTSEIIDGYNDLMSYISVKSNDGDVDAQISSMKSLQDEFYNLSRGVDENGKNLALSTEEYARYCDIVDQILSYTPSLVAGYDAEGNAILDLSVCQAGYNSLLAESIELLKKQQQEAAKQTISNETLGKVIDNANANYDSTIRSASNYDILNYGKDNSNLTRTANIISGIIGVEQNGLDKFFGINEADYVIKNAEAIAENKDKILQAMSDTGYYGGNELDKYSEWFDGLIESARHAAEQANAEIRNSLYVAPQASEHYDDMSGEQLNFINSYISSLEGLKDKTANEVEGIANGIVDLMSLINSSDNLQNAINDIMMLDPSSMPIDAYRKKFAELWDDTGSIIPVEHQEAFRNYLFPDEGQIDEMIAEVQEKLATSSKGLVKNLNLEELRIAYKIIPELSDNINFEELRKEIQERLPKATGPIVETYSALTEQVTKYNEIATQTSEIILDNTKVTQEYKDSLVELGISEEELSECFDATNGLVVTNAKELNRLVKNTKKNTAQNAKLAKSQARLQYYELYKEMSKLVGANGRVTDGNIDVVRSLYEEMNALEKTIAKYSMLEAQLLGNVNAFEKFQEAQEIDSATDYMGSAEEMVLALGEAFNTAELGSESAQAAILGLVPKSVYEDLDTVDEKMAAIYDYFRNGQLSQYFTLEFDDDGKIESAEMKLVNLKNFIEDGLSGDKNKDGINPFVGDDWQHFELNQTWLDSLPEGTDVLQALADQMNVTKEVAFAFVKSFKDHDIEWLDGDYSTFFDQMLSSTNEGKIQLYTERLADLTMQQAELAEEKNNVYKQFKDGAISEEEYSQRIKEINEKQNELNKSLDDYNKKLAEAKNSSKQSIFGVGAKGTKYEGKVDYQIKTTSEIKETSNLDELDNWIERNEKVKQLYEEQEDAQEAYTKALEDYEAAVEDNGGKELDANHEVAVALKEKEDAYKNVTDAVTEAIRRRDEFAKPTVLEIEVAIDDVEKQIESTRESLDKKLSDGTHTITVEIDGQKIEQSVASTEELLDSCFHMDEDGYWVINAGVDKSELEQKYPEILSYVNLLNSNTTLNAYLNDSDVQVTLDTLSTQIEKIIELLEGMKISLDPTSVEQFSAKLGELCKPRNIWANVKAFWGGLTGGAQNVNGTAHVGGTAHKSGDWGLPQSEHNSLVGELGPEMVVDPSTGRYYTVGDAGAEMVDLPKGAIIFNHKQTESLLKNGYVTSRGKAYAEGNAHVTIWTDGASKDQWKGTKSSSNYSSNNSKNSDNSDKFEEVFDWIEVRLEELEEAIGLLEAALENASNYVSKNNIIDEIIDINNIKLANLKAGYQEYADYASKLLAKIPEEYRDAAQNGAIAIEEFVGEADEKTLEAIQNYREWTQKSADLKQQIEEVITTIRDLAIQKFDNAYEAGDVRATVEDSQTEKLQNAVDYDEERGLITSDAYYVAMMENSNKKIEYLTNARKAMQKELNAAVEAGQIERGSNEWYELIDQMYQIDASIDEATIELEEFQNAINDLYWDNFEQLTNRLDYLKDETKSLIDLMANDDLVADPTKRKYEGGTIEYWTADDVKWTDEGIASLGLYAQQMEIAEYTARQYAEAIDDLEKDYKAGLYSENEYIEKLEELKDSQYENIEAYYEAQDAIVELNETRIDSIKDGIEAEIDAYEELIENKKKLLDSEKD